MCKAQGIIAHVLAAYCRSLSIMWTQLKKRAKKLPAYLRNPFLIVTVLFLVWMLFLDENNLLNQYRKYRELHDLLEKKDYYLQQTEKTQKELTELTGNAENQEKFAREHYWMKRDSEDVYVIVHTDKTKP